MTAIKQNILQRMDVAPMPIRIASIKFLQKVVQVQTPGLIADPRVRRDHKSWYIMGSNRCTETGAQRDLNIASAQKPPITSITQSRGRNIRNT